MAAGIPGPGSRRPAAGEVAAAMGWSLPYTLAVLNHWRTAAIYCRAVLSHNQRIALDGTPAEPVYGRVCHDDVGLLADQLLRARSYSIDVIDVKPTNVDPDIAAIGPTQARERLHERQELWSESAQHDDAPDTVALLRARHHRPRRCAAEPRDESPALIIGSPRQQWPTAFPGWSGRAPWWF